MHDLLLRQLKRLKLNESASPSNEEWISFLERINKTYVENDQERYLLERSLDISSHEMMDLNDKLESAQEIANLGSWSYNREEDRVWWSNELYQVLGLSKEEFTPVYKNILLLFPEDERKIIEKSVEEAFLGKTYELEARMMHRDGRYRWFYIKGGPDKTAEKIKSISGIVIDITEEKKSAEEINLLNKQLIVSARRAGISEVATYILHNIGNVLNSVNVSINIIQESLGQSRTDKIIEAINLIKEHHDQLVNYLQKDPKGKLIPVYLIKSAEILNCEYKKLNDEIMNITNQVKFIKEIVAMQKTFGGTSALLEKIELPELIDSAIRLSEANFKTYGINIKFNHDKVPLIMSDKHKLLQIFINLIQNAKDALSSPELGIKEKKIIIDITLKNKTINITFSDNGIGIESKNLTRIFSFGFTTKAKGHGFGLHSCALIAKELGGELIAKSKGTNKGAQFTLILPLQFTPVRNKQYEHQI